MELSVRKVTYSPWYCRVDFESLHCVSTGSLRMIVSTSYGYFYRGCDTRRIVLFREGKANSSLLEAQAMVQQLAI